MDHGIMIDLETTGTAPGSAIVSLGACLTGPALGPETERPTFYRVMNVNDALALGLTSDADTERWWVEKAPKDAQLELTRYLVNQGWNYGTVLTEFRLWLGALRAKYFINSFPVWANGAAFDPVLLEVAWRKTFKDSAQDLPWPYYEVRCYRTLRALYKTLRGAEALAAIESANPADPPHHALGDAVAQARRLEAMLTDLGG